MRNSSYGYYNNSANESNWQLTRATFIDRSKLAKGQATRNYQNEKFVLVPQSGNFITIGYDEYRVNYSPLGFCPALNIESWNVIFSHLVSGTAGEPNAEYSLTIRDEAITLGLQQSKRAYKDTSSGTTKVVVPYYCSTKSPNSKVDSYVDRYSVLITDKSLTSSGANILHYKKIKDTNLGTEQEESGELIFDLPDNLPESYKLYILAENVSGKTPKDTKYAQYYEIPQVYDEPMNVIDNIEISVNFDDLTKELDDQITCLTPQVDFWQVISKVDGNSRGFYYLVSNRKNKIMCNFSIKEDMRGDYVLGDSPTVTIVDPPDNLTDITAWYEKSGVFDVVCIELTTGKFDPKVTCPFKFTKPSNLVCDGTPKEAIVEPSEYRMDDVNGMGDITVKYYKDGVQLDSPPIAPGEYVVKIDVTEGADFLAATDIITSNRYYPWTFSITGSSYAEEDFTFTPPSDLKYDGQPKEASISINDTVVGGGSITAIKYYKEGSTVPLTGAPTDAGKYIVKADVSGGERYYSETDLTYSDWNFTITRGTLKAEDFDFTPPTDTEYNGTEKTASVVPKSGVTGLGNFSVKYYLDDNEATPKEVGSYKVKISAEQGTNYFAADLESDSWAFDITQKPVTVTANNKSKVIGDADPVLDYTVEPELISGDSFSGELIRESGETVGIYDINRGTLDNSNYNITYNGGKFTIVKAQANVTAPTAANTLVYGHTLADAGLTAGWTWEDEDIVPDVNNTGYTAYKEVTDYDSVDYSSLSGIDYDETTHKLSCTVAVTVNMATPSVTIPTASEITYGEALSASTLSDTNWSWVDETVIPTVQNSGYPAKITVDDSNYDYTSIDGYDSSTHKVTRTIAVSVNKATPTISVIASPTSDIAGKTITVTASAQNPNNDEFDDFPTPVFTYKVGESGTETAFTDSFVIPEGTPVGTVITITAKTSENESYNEGTGTAKVTVIACEHTDVTTEWEKDSTGHWHICNYCGAAVDKANHTEDSGTVTKEPTETTEGEMTFKCTECGWVIRTEPISELEHIHVPSDEYSKDETGHWHTCSGCTEKVDFAEHTYGDWKITVPATAEANGKKERSCTVCGYVQEGVVTYGGDESTGDMENATDPDTNACHADLELTDEEIIDKIPLTPEELEAVENGADLEVYMVVIDYAAKIPAEEKALAESVLKDGMEIGMYIDVTLFVKVGDNDPRAVTNTNGDLKITFEMPEKLINTDKNVTRQYSIIRVHSGEAAILDCAYDNATAKGSFKTDRFSSYAIAYKDIVEEEIIEEPEVTPAEEAAEKIKKVLDDFTPGNDTTAEDILEVIKSVVDEDITVEITDFEKVPATEDNDGSITIKITITDDEGNTETVERVMIIPKLSKPEKPAVTVYYPIITSGNVYADKHTAAAGETVNVRASIGYDIIVTAENGQRIAKITEKGSFVMPASKVYVTAAKNEIFELMATAWSNSYVYSYDADMNKIKVNSTKKRGVIIINLGEDYAGKSFTIYSGRKSTKVKVTEGEFDENGKFVFEVPDGKNYTLVVED